MDLLPVVDEIGSAGEAGNRRDSHNLALLSFDHRGQNLLDHPEVREDVDVEGALQMVMPSLRSVGACESHKSLTLMSCEFRFSNGAHRTNPALSAGEKAMFVRPSDGVLLVKSY